MPGSVDNASPSVVMPDGLCSLFTASREIWIDRNDYRNGERQVALKASTSRRSWEIARALEIGDVYTLRNFFVNVGVSSFYFYDIISDKTAVYDPTGVLTTGRHTVRFEGGWQQESPKGYTSVGLRLVEVN